MPKFLSIKFYFPAQRQINSDKFPWVKRENFQGTPFANVLYIQPHGEFYKGSYIYIKQICRGNIIGKPARKKGKRRKKRI